MKTERKRIRRAALSLVLGMLMALLLALPAGAENMLHDDGDVHIHIASSNNSVHPAGVRLAIYEVAEGSYFEGQAHLLADFAEAETHVSMEDMIDHTADAAHALEDWVEHVHHTEPVEIAETDENGDVEFQHLEDGIYLICQENGLHDFDEAEFVVEVEPYLIELPEMDREGRFYKEVFCKPKAHFSSGPTDTVRVEVEKHWEDQADQAGLRPASIQVTLLRNGASVETVTLSAAENWRYVWENLDASYTWSVKETAVPAGYVSQVSTEGELFIITNRLSPTPSPSPSVTPTPTPGSPTSPYTGDGTRIWMYLAAMAVSALGILLLARRGRKSPDR